MLHLSSFYEITSHCIDSNRCRTDVPFFTWHCSLSCFHELNAAGMHLLQRFSWLLLNYGLVKMENKALAAAVMVASLVLLGFGTPAVSLIINTTLTACSTTCESKNCGDPFDLRYGKYCGLGYTGCDGQAPCDGIDSCCLTHDNCIGSNLENYVNRTCNEALKDCVEQFKDAKSPQFAGSNCSATEVETVIIDSMDVASQLGNSAGRPQINLHWVEALVAILSLILLFGW